MNFDAIASETLVIVALVLLNGVLAMSELAILSAKKVRLQQMSSKGSLGARTALSLAETPSDFLASVQVGITLIGILNGAFGGGAIAAEIAKVIGHWGLLAPYAQGLSLSVVVVGITLLSLIFGELVPKRLALAHAERFAVWLAAPVKCLAVGARPAVRVLSFFTETVVRIMGIKPSTEPAVTEEEVKVMVEQGTQAGVFDKDEESIIKRVLGFGDYRVGDLMTQRVQLVALDINDPDTENLKKMLATPHSYFPVYQDTEDHIVGLVSVKSVLAAVVQEPLPGIQLGLRHCLQEPLFVAESMSTLKLLEQFKSTGKHLALVVDEYGATAGIVTAIDILETLVGNLPGLYDGDGDGVIKRDDGSFLVDGIISIRDLAEYLPSDVLAARPEGEYQTLGGFVMAILGHIPKAGQWVSRGGYRFEVVDMDGLRVDKVLISKENDNT